MHQLPTTKQRIELEKLCMRRATVKSVKESKELEKKIKSLRKTFSIPINAFRKTK